MSSERNLAILRLHENNGWRACDLAYAFELSNTRIAQIIAKERRIRERDRKHEEFRRQRLTAARNEKIERNIQTLVEMWARARSVCTYLDWLDVDSLDTVGDT